MRCLLALAAALAAVTPGAAAELLINGGFETGTLAGWFTNDGTTYAGGPTSAHTGQHGAVYVLGAGQLQQDFKTIPGDSYTMSFWLDIPGRNPDPAVLNEIAASIVDANTGTGSQYQTYDVTPFPYTKVTLAPFVAKSRTSQVNIDLYSGAFTTPFKHQNGSPVDWYVDDVSVTGTPYASAPEPATWALLLSGFGLTGTAIRRRTAIAAV